MESIFKDLVFLRDIKEFSGGLLSPSYFRLLEWQAKKEGKPFPTKIKIGRCVAFKKDELSAWLKTRYLHGSG